MAGSESFDVIVIGAGAAGSVIAARLAESKARSVLLLEAGPDLREVVPGGLRNGWSLNRDYYWSIASEPDERGEVQSIPRCRLVGGTSWMTRFAVRGSPADFTEWVDLGNPGWGYDEVLPFFNRLETDVDFAGQPWHGAEGPIPVDRYFEFERTEVHEAAVHAMEAVGIPGLTDHNMPGAVGVGRMPMSGRNGDRVSVADAYLHPGHAPPNLTIRPDAVVGRILFDGFRARGVELVDTTVIEAGWVVVSAGVFGSPPLLMRSGIGPSDHLRSLGITPLVDLGGVGANLGDHPGTDLDCGYQGGGRADPLLHSIATLHSEQASTTEPPDLLLWVADPSEQPGETPAFYIDIVLLKPRARGSIRLRSVDPTDPPQVELPDWRGGSDLDRLVEGYRVALEVAHRAELRSLCRPAMGLEEKAEDLRDVIRNNSWSVPHFVGGCSMGPADNPMAVVDATGRVHGTEALSVVDASIIPIVPSGFTHLPTIMLAERLAGQIGAVL